MNIIFTGQHFYLKRVSLFPGFSESAGTLTPLMIYYISCVECLMTDYLQCELHGRS